MANLKTHEGRMEALEYALNRTTSGVDEAQIIQIAAQLDSNEKFYKNPSIYAENAAGAIVTISTGEGN